MKLLLFALAAAALMKKSNPGIGKVTTYNPAVQFFYNGIKINGKLIKGLFLENKNKVVFYSDGNSFELDSLLNKFFNTKNDSDIMTDYFEDTRIYFSSSENPDYYPAALKVLEEIEQRKIKDREKRIDKFNDWLYTLDIYADNSSGNPVISVYKDGKLLAVFTRNTYRLLSGSMNVYNLKEFVRTNGFDNAFAAYL